ncbi:hypothetical protein PGT21_021374 [Puccinia graminis f. sp. tritici]|uniref:Uncharacterized protein n=1 Tax=Puccinia graminis f. sp. tritici TaxID=56615 RepID=A0A5B0LM27_PUCGR|nr:hypothetical protein PGT21_020544 [Puccinia graminis f. sp. tritici]KAA1071100.1 hypothetical protein PGTUg99_014516 [Puccinia graminis f. sp. tritici]KAA1085839.1 hypothetical protein PGT21_021374 [Puccinia graminis f. sp. tritici]KAA1112124.1 hypothetical protein PGTUg99_002879 [Puccinia graminis f. sp. tritici]
MNILPITCLVLMSATIMPSVLGQAKPACQNCRTSNPTTKSPRFLKPANPSTEFRLCGLLSEPQTVCGVRLVGNMYDCSQCKSKVWSAINKCPNCKNFPPDEYKHMPRAP